MKYCTYCGTELEDERGIFCPECGKTLTDEAKKSTVQKEKSKKDKRRKSKENKRQNRRISTPDEKFVEESEMVDDGYDGYYDDILPVDEGKFRQGIDKEMMKRISGLLVGVLITICACVAIMYLL